MLKMYISDGSSERIFRTNTRYIITDCEALHQGRWLIESVFALLGQWYGRSDIDSRNSALGPENVSVSKSCAWSSPTDHDHLLTKVSPMYIEVIYEKQDIDA
eukprot:40914_1